MGEQLQRGLLGCAGGVIDEAVATAPDGHQLDRALNAKTTLLCLLTGCLFTGQGYDQVLRTAFAMPGLGVKPGTLLRAARRCPRPARCPASTWRGDLNDDAQTRMEFIP